MTPNILTVLIILVIAIILFITEWVRMDVVALMVLGSLALFGIVSPSEALSGFSNPAVVTVWAILMLSGALARTGVAGLIGRRVLHLAGNSDVRLLVIIMLTVGILSGFMNDIGVASLFLPVVIDIARRTNRAPSKLLMPLAFASLLGGLTTLIGTPPNILISEALKDAGLTPFQMFDYTPIGLIILLSGTAFMAIIGRRLLPDRDISREISSTKSTDYKSIYELHERMMFLKIPHDSSLDGKTLAESRLGSVLGINIISIVRNGQTFLAPDAKFCLRSHDRLLVEGRLEKFFELQKGGHLKLEDERIPIQRLVSSEVDMVEVRFSPESPLIGHSLHEIGFRHSHHVIVLAIKRGGIVLRTNLSELPLLSDDTLLVQGHRTQLDILREESDLLVTIPDLLDEYNLEERLMMVLVPEESFLVGKTLVESCLGDAYNLTVMGILRKDEKILLPSPDERLEVGDTLLLKGKQIDLFMLEGIKNLEIEEQSSPELGDLESEETGIAEVILSPHTRLNGETLRKINFRAKFGLSVLAIWREGRAYRTNLREMALKFGDALLVYGPRQRLRQLGAEPDFLVLTEEAQEVPRLNKAPLAILVMAMVLVPVVLGWVSIAIAAVVGVTLMILTRCITMEEAYRSIQWKAIFLIAGMLPMGIAMEQTGAARFLADAMVSGIGQFGPLVVLAGLFLLAAFASQVMPNPAVAVLLAPIALSTAADLGVSPYPLMMAIAISASAAFLSPVGHSANVLVMGPGGYRFSDFIKVGLPLTLVVLAVSLLMIPVFWPF